MLDRVSNQIEKYMDLVATRQRLIAANIANVDTPGYRTKDINFQDEFQNMVPGGNPRITEVQDLKVKNDGNDVSLDREARMLSENNLRFSFAETLLKDRLKTIASAIQEGSK